MAVARLIEAAGSIKYQTALSLAYGTGLRAGEVIALEVGDIDSQRMTLHVERGKGQKDHLAVSSLRTSPMPADWRRHILNCWRVRAGIGQPVTITAGGESECVGLD